MRNRLVSRFTNDAQIKVVDFLIAQYRGKKKGKERNRATDRQVIKAARESKSGGI